MRLDSFSPCCMSHEQHRVEHSTCSLNLFQLVSYHASVTLFTHNYILAHLCVSFNFPALVSASSRSLQRKSWAALQYIKATLHQHFSPIKARKSRTLWNFLSSPLQFQSINSSIEHFWYIAFCLTHICAPPVASDFVLWTNKCTRQQNYSHAIKRFFFNIMDSGKNSVLEENKKLFSMWMENGWKRCRNDQMLR